MQQLVSLASDRQQRIETNRIAWIGAIATALSTIVALAALWFSVSSERRSRRNETANAKLRSEGHA